MITLYESFMNHVHEGKRGLNEGIPYTVDKINRYTQIRRKRYKLYFAQPGVGKSSIVYDQHLYYPIRKVLSKQTDIDVFNIFFNLEIDNIDIIGILTAKYLWDEFQILTDKDSIFSHYSRINPKLEKYLEDPGLVSFIKEFEKRTLIYNYANKNFIKEKVYEVAKCRGKLEETETKVIYIPKNRKELVQIITDHVTLIKNIDGDNPYETLVDVSKFKKDIRNQFGWSPIDIQQINPEKQTYKDKDRVLPDHEHLKWGKEIYENADECFALGSPFKAQKEVYAGYKVIISPNNDNEGIGDRLTILHLRKNRGGAVGNPMSMLFVGEIGRFANIDSPADIDYQKIMKISKNL